MNEGRDVVEAHVIEPASPVHVPVHRGLENDLTELVNREVVQPWGRDETERWVPIGPEVPAGVAQEVWMSFEAAGWSIRLEYPHSQPKGLGLRVGDREIPGEECFGFVVYRPRWHRPSDASEAWAEVVAGDRHDARVRESMREAGA